jgi:hypothetical protein
MADEDFVQLIEDHAHEAPAQEPVRRWKIAVIDDEPAVHEGTRFALSDYQLNGQASKFCPRIRRPKGVS